MHPWLQTARLGVAGSAPWEPSSKAIFKQTQRAREGRALSCGRRGRCRGSARAQRRSQITSAAAVGRKRQGPGGGRAPQLPGHQPPAALKRGHRRARAGRGAARRGEAGGRPSRQAGGLRGRVSPCSDAVRRTAWAMLPGIRAALRLGGREAELRCGRLRGRARRAPGAGAPGAPGAGSAARACHAAPGGAAASPAPPHGCRKKMATGRRRANRTREFIRGGWSCWG